MKEHYVYIHLHPSTNEIFYVGKGKGYRKSSKNARNHRWLEYVEKLTEPYKILVVCENMDENGALELERKIIRKIDWHYEDASTNVTDAQPHFDDKHSIQIVFNRSYQPNDDDKYIPQIRFQNLTDDEIISKLLEFPNELEIEKLTLEFKNICAFLYDNWDEIEEIDEDIFYDLEGVVDTIEDLFNEYKSSENENISELATDLKREKIEIEIIQEDSPKGKQKKFLNDLANWIDNVVERITTGNNV